VSTTDIGRRAEAAAAKFLEQKGYEILDRNWRTRYCEIDIVALKDKTVYFVEVKYRRSHAYGSGLDYVTTAKQRQMAFSAEMWVNNLGWQGSYELAALAVTGRNPFVAKLALI
jgi:uncharacterized protein (TIGR00252 family)